LRRRDFVAIVGLTVLDCHSPEQAPATDGSTEETMPLGIKGSGAIVAGGCLPGQPIGNQQPSQTVFGCTAVCEIVSPGPPIAGDWLIDLKRTDLVYGVNMIVLATMQSQVNEPYAPNIVGVGPGLIRIVTVNVAHQEAFDYAGGISFLVIAFDKTP
jgi:hypothetical protein